MHDILEQVGSVQTGPEMTHRDNIALGTSQNTDWSSSKPLGASRGQTKQIMVGMKVVYGILEQTGSF